MDFKSRSFARHAAGVVIVLGLVITVDIAVAVFTSNPVTLHWTLPGFSSVGATVSMLSIGVWLLTYVVAPAVIFRLGYGYGRSETASTS